MNPAETVLLLRKVRAYRPAQIVDDLTADAWEEALSDIRFEDADQAVREIVKVSSLFIDPAAIRSRVREIRAARLAEHPPVEPPPGLTPEQYVAWLRGTQKRIGDGEKVADNLRGELKPRPIRLALGPKR